MARLFIRRDLEQVVGGLVLDTVNEVARETEAMAKQFAPSTKIWRTQNDALVRPEHRPLEGQEIVEGFRFRAKSFDWDKENRGLGQYTYLKQPRDRSSRSLIHVRNCRCYTEKGTGVEDGISRRPAIIRRDDVVAVVESASPWAVIAEYGMVYPNGQESRGSYYMARAAKAIKQKVGVT